MHEFKIKFYLPPDSNPPYEPRTVQARIYLDNQRDYLTATKVIVTDKIWNAGLEKVKLNTPEGHLMNHRLDILRKQVTDIYHLYAADEHLSLALIKLFRNCVFAVPSCSADRTAKSLCVELGNRLMVRGIALKRKVNTIRKEDQNLSCQIL